MASSVRSTSWNNGHAGPPAHGRFTCAGSTSRYRRPWSARSSSSAMGVVRKTLWSQLHTLTRAPTASTVEAQPPADDRASRTTVRNPARARYAPQINPL